MRYTYDIGLQGWLLMLAMMVVMVILTVVAVVAIVRAVRSGGTTSSARSALDERYARGEISSEKYDEQKRRLDQQ